MPWLSNSRVSITIFCLFSKRFYSIYLFIYFSNQMNGWETNLGFWILCWWLFGLKKNLFCLGLGVIRWKWSSNNFFEKLRHGFERLTLLSFSWFFRNLMKGYSFLFFVLAKYYVLAKFYLFLLLFFLRYGCFHIVMFISKNYYVIFESWKVCFG